MQKKTYKKPTLNTVKLLPEWHDIDRPEDLCFIEDNPTTPESSECLTRIRRNCGKNSLL